MSRNIWLTFEEWTEIRKELGIKRERCKFSNEMKDEYWNFYLPDNQIKKWKEDIKRRKEKYGLDDEGRCFERTGVQSDTLKKIKSQHLINRLCEQDWRPQDFGYNFFNLKEERNFNLFIGWIFNTQLREKLDITTSREKLHRLWQLMSKKIELESETRWFTWTLEKLANEILVVI
tara:strand:- start:230 stop:754 length:525 start_codon:yes stop_codon:yes gene_type:complete